MLQLQPLMQLQVQDCWLRFLHSSIILEDHIYSKTLQQKKKTIRSTSIEEDKKLIDYLFDMQDHANLLSISK